MRSYQHLQFYQPGRNIEYQPLAKRQNASNYIYMIVFAVQYTYALCNVFSGPLFLDIFAGYILDSIIWGVAPILFFFIQPRLRRLISKGKNCYKIRFGLLIVFTIFKLLSYAMMNYNQKFKWNNLSKVFNLDFGYSLLNLSCKVIYFIFANEESENTQDTGSTYLQYSFYGNISCYFIGFYIAFMLNENGEYYYKSLQVTSIIGCILNLPIPIFYYFKNKDKIFNDENEVHTQNYRQNSLSNKLNYRDKVEVVIQFFIQASSVTNLSYSTLWIMDNLKKLGTDEGKAFTQSILYGSFFFLFSTIFFYSSSYFSSACIQYRRLICLVFCFLYGILMLVCYIQFTGKEICYVILGCGIQLAIGNFIQQQRRLSYVIMSKIMVLSQFFIFCLVPITLTFLKIDDYEVYILISGVCSLLSGVILLTNFRQQISLN